MMLLELISPIISIGGALIMLGIYVGTIRDHSRRIEELEKRERQLDELYERKTVLAEKFRTLDRVEKEVGQIRVALFTFLSKQHPELAKLLILD